MKKKKILRTKKYLNIVLYQKRITKHFMISLSKFMKKHIDFLAINSVSFEIKRCNEHNAKKYKYIFGYIDGIDEMVIYPIPINKNPLQNKHIEAQIDEILKRTFPDPEIHIRTFMKE